MRKAAPHPACDGFRCHARIFGADPSAGLSALLRLLHRKAKNAPLATAAATSPAPTRKARGFHCLGGGPAITGAALLSVAGTALLSVTGTALLSVAGTALLSVTGTALLSVAGTALLSVMGTSPPKASLMTSAS